MSFEAVSIPMKGGNYAGKLSEADLTTRIQEHIHFLLLTYPGINKTHLAIGTINQSYGKRWQSVLAGMIEKKEVFIRSYYANNPVTGRLQKFIHLFSARDERTNIGSYPTDEEVVRESMILKEFN